jgi:mono/diheme cytochrome c family protein
VLRVAQGRGRFIERCGICHQSAETLARDKLILVGGALRGRYTGRDMTTFLLRHGTRDAEEAAFFERVLRRHTPTSIEGQP